MLHKILYTIKTKMSYLTNLNADLYRKNIEIVKKLNEPKDVYERSYNQYKCSKIWYNSIIAKVLLVLLNLVFFLLLIPFTFIIFFSKFFVKEKESTEKFKKAFFYGSKNLKLIPDSLFEEFDDIIVNNIEGYSYSKHIRKITLVLIKKYFFSPVYIYKNFYKMCAYQYIIDNEKISAIICLSEYSYTSSVLTQLCRENNIEHINVEHGMIDLKGIRSFFIFDRCYVWNEYFKEKCIEMRAEKNQFIIETPEAVLFKKNDVEKKCKYKYYLNEQNKIELYEIKKMLEKLDDKYKVRPHPLFYKNRKNEYIEVFGLDRVENPLEVSTENSILESENIIARLSTVLYQGYMNGISIIVDDNSSDALIMLNILDSYILHVPHKLLSELLKEIESENENE